MGEIVIKPPGADKPGFLRRLRRSMELQQELRNGGVGALERLCAFVLAEAVIEKPVGATEADVRDALYEMSLGEWRDLLVSIAGTDAVVP